MPAPVLLAPRIGACRKAINTRDPTGLRTFENVKRGNIPRVGQKWHPVLTTAPASERQRYRCAMFTVLVLLRKPRIAAAAAAAAAASPSFSFHRDSQQRCCLATGCSL
nr:unnamed protein product [Digitaria exilis]